MSDQAEKLRELVEEMGLSVIGVDEDDETEQNAISAIDNYHDGYFWAHSKFHDVWYLLQKSTDRQTFGRPWKDVNRGDRITWQEITQRFDRLVKVEEPK